MAAGTKYNLKAEYVPEEIYRVETGVRKSGPWKLDIANLVVGSYLPVFTPVFADLKKRTVVPVRNFEVAEDFTTSGSNKVMKIKKGSLAYAGSTSVTPRREQLFKVLTNPTRITTC